jgi:hypothetical protein
MAFVELMHFLMLIRKWIADFFSLRPHQNVGPTEGRRDQRRQRTVDNLNEQPVITDLTQMDPCWLQQVMFLVHGCVHGGVVWCGVA